MKKKYLNSPDPVPFYMKAYNSFMSFIDLIDFDKLILTVILLGCLLSKNELFNAIGISGCILYHLTVIAVNAFPTTHVKVTIKDDPEKQEAY